MLKIFGKEDQKEIYNGIFLNSLVEVIKKMNYVFDEKQWFQFAPKINDLYSSFSNAENDGSWKEEWKYVKSNLISIGKKYFNVELGKMGNSESLLVKKLSSLMEQIKESLKKDEVQKVKSDLQDAYVVNNLIPKKERDSFLKILEIFHNISKIYFSNNKKMQFSQSENMLYQTNLLLNKMVEALGYKFTENNKNNFVITKKV